MTQSAIHAALGVQMVPQTVHPPVTLGNASLWPNSTDSNNPYWTTPTGTDIPLLIAGPGAGTYGGGSNFINSLTLDANARITAVTTGAPGGAGGAAWSFAEAALGSVASSDGYVSTASGGSFTVGGTFKVTQPCTIVGARYYWAGGLGALTIKISVWDPTGTRVATANVAVNAAGIYSVTFGSPVSVLAANVMRNYTLGTWDTAGNSYTHVTGGGFLLIPGRFDFATQMSILASGLLMWTTLNLTASGDAKPATPDASEYFPVDVTLTVP